jgi:hypothetical protein
MHANKLLRGICAALITSLVFIVLPGAAASADQAITSAGPLTTIGTTSDLNCSVNHTGDTAGEWYGDTACGTLLSSGGTLYGPANIPAGGSAAPRTGWTPVSQTGVTGSGTSADPYKVVTVATGGAFQITQTDTYVVGAESYRNDVQVTNTGSAAATGVLYRAGDCYLQDSDFGYGIYSSTTGAITCTPSLTPGSRIEQMLPITSGSNYYEGYYNSMWAAIGTQNPFPNTCDCSTNEDNSIGLSWNFNLASGASQTYSSIVTFSPLGSQPVALTKTADSANVGGNGTDGYTITATNPNATAVTLAPLTDTLGAGFGYQAGTTTGATTTDPTVSGQTLTWDNINVPASGSTSLHFNVTAPNTAGTFTDDAEGTATGFTVVGTGATAPVTVTPAQTHAYSISLAPASGSDPVGGAHTVTATTSDSGSPLAGQAVQFSVTSGPDAGQTGSGTTDASGQATFTVNNGGTAGTDTIAAQFTDPASNVDTATPVTETWTVVHHYAISLAPASGSDPVGGAHTVTATASDSGSPLAGQAVQFSVTSGPDAGQTGSGTTDASGQATFTVNNGGTAGTDTIAAQFTDPANNVDTATPVTETWTAAIIGPSVDSKASGQAYNAATATLTTTQPGDLLVAFVAADAPLSGGQTSTVSGAGLTWRLVGRESAQLGDAEVWVARATGTLNQAHITARVRKLGFDETITVVAFKNATGIGQVARSNHLSGAPSGQLTTSQPNSWVWSIGDDWLASIHRTVGPNQTIVHQATDRVGDTYWVQTTNSLTPAAGATVTIDDTAPTSDPYNMVLVEIL